MQPVDNGIATMRTIIERIRTIDWVGDLRLGDRILRELVDEIAIIEVIDPTGDTRLVAHGVPGEELLAGPLVAGLFGASDHVHKREVPAENGGVVFHGYVLPIDPDAELPNDADLADCGAWTRDYWRRASVASPAFALARLLAWVPHEASPWCVVADLLGRGDDPDPSHAMDLQGELDWWHESSAGYAFGGQCPGWLVLGPNVVRMWGSVARASADGVGAGPVIAAQAVVVAQLLAHELCHAVTPFSIDDIWDEERDEPRSLDWLEEGGAYVLPAWRGHASRLAGGMGFVLIDDVAGSPWADPRFQAMRALLALLDLDIDRPQDEDVAFGLLLRPRLTDVPAVLAGALDRHLGLGLDPSGISMLAQRVLAIDGDVEDVHALRAELGVASPS